MVATTGVSLGTLDTAIEEVAARHRAWATADATARIGILDRMITDTDVVAADWVDVECARKGVAADSPTAGEEWFVGPLIVLRHLRLLRNTLASIERSGRPDLPRPMEALPDGQAAVRVFPTDAYDRLLFMGVTGQTRLEPGVSLAEAEDAVGGIYRTPGARDGGTAVVLGAGNISAIPACDVLAQLFAADRVVVLKLSPLTQTLAPVLERAFAALVEGGYLRIVQGGATEARHLVEHESVDTVHLTGSAATHDALVFGTGREGTRRKAAGTPRLAKTVVAELGNVTPLIVVPGPWSSADVRYQSEHIATGAAHNAGVNCVSTRVVLTQRGWDRRANLLDALRSVLRRVPNRVAYYPGTNEKMAALLAAHPQAELLGAGPTGSLPWGLLTGLDPIEAKALAEVETFAPFMSEVAIDAASAAEFVDRAVAYCNDEVWGTLAVTLLVHPASMRDARTADAVHRAVADLRYGTVGVNIWAASAFGLVSPPWGAFRSDDPTDTQSGRGFVHNTYLLPRPQKTVMRAPFRSVPKPAWFVTHRQALPTLRAAAHLNATTDPRTLPGLFASALRG